jgi:translocation and assembly module TamB
MAAVTAVMVAFTWAYGDVTARRYARLTLEEQLRALLAGEVHVDRVVALSFGGIRAEGVWVRDAQGRTVLYARELELDFDFWALSSNSVRFTRGHLEDGFVRLVPSETLVVTLFEALSPPETEAPDTTSSPSSTSIHFEGISVDRMQVRGDVPGLAGVDVENLSVRGRIDIDNLFRAQVYTLSANIRGPYAVPARLEAGQLSVSAPPIDVRGSFRIKTDADERVHGKLIYLADDTKEHIDLALGLSKISSDTLIALQLGLPETLIGDVSGPIRLEGSRDNLAFHAAFDTAGGVIGVHGRYEPERRTVVRLATRQLELSELLAYAPPVSLGVTVQAVAEAGAPIAIVARSQEVDTYGIRVRRVVFEGEYDKGRLDLTDAGFDYAGGRFHVSGHVMDTGDLALRVQSLVPDTTHAPALRREGLRARLATDLTLTQAAGELALEGRLGLENLTYENLGAKNLQIQGRVSGDFEAPRVRVTAKGTGVTLSDFELGQVSLRLNGDRRVYVAEAEALDSLGRRAKARVQLEDRKDALRILAEPLSVSVPGRPPWRAAADVILDDDGVELRRVSLDNGPQHLEAAGRFSRSRAYRVEATLKAFDLGGLRELSGLDLADLDGTVEGSLALTGVPGKPRIDVQGWLKDGQFLGMTGLDVMATMVFAEGRFDLNGEIILPDESRLAVTAGGVPGKGADFVSQVGSGRYEFAVDFERVPFSVSRPWLAWLGIEPPKGNISAVIRGSGALDAPVIDVSTRVAGIVLDPWPALDIDLSFTHDQTTLTLRSLEIADAKGELVSAKGYVEARPAELFDVEGLRASLAERPFALWASFPERRLDELPEPIRQPRAVITSGTLAVEQGGGGPRMSGAGTARFVGGAQGIEACGIERFPEAKLSLLAQGSRGEIEARMSLDGREVGHATLRSKLRVNDWITGRAPLAWPPTSLTFEGKTPDTEEVPVLCEHAQGPLALRVEADNLFADPPSFSFGLSSPALQLVPHASQEQRLGGTKETRSAGRPFAVDVRGGVDGARFSLVAQIGAGDGASLDVFASLPRAALAPNAKREELGTAEARIRVRRMELARLLVALPSSVRAAAQMNGEARVAYGFADDSLDLEGELTLSQGRLAIPALGQELADLGVKLRLLGDTVRIENLRARDFEGSLEANGELRFETARHAYLELQTRLRDFPVRREGAQVSKLSGGLAIRAEIDEERTRAEIDVGDLRVDLPNDLGQELQDLDPHPNVVVVGEEREPPPDAPYTYEARIIAREPPFRISRTDMRAEVRTDLTVRYRDPVLSIQGSAELRRGSFELYGKRFELQDSRLAFDSQGSLDPLVSLYATHKIGADEIGVRLEGRLSAPRVTFTHSDPSITDSGQIIAQLLGGRSSDTSSERDATGAAASFLAGATAGLLTEEVRREFGGAIPVLAIESGDQAFRSTRIRAGVQLDRFIEKRLGPLRHVVRGAYVEGFVTPGADPEAATQTTAPQSQRGGLLELRFPADFLGSIEYRPVQNWRIDVAWEP